MRLSTIVVAVPAAVALLCGSTAAQCVEGCTVIHEFTGEVAGDTFGWVSDDIGDLDGDQIHDLILTSPFYDAAFNNVGRVYVYSGATGLLLFPAVTGTLPGEQLGRDVDPAFDVNNDLQPDVIVGASLNGAGRAYVFSGSDGSLLWTFTGQAFGDGKTDYLVTAANDSGGTGKAYLIAGIYPRAGDVDGDGFVTIGDFLQLLAQWGPCADCQNCNADFDDDCIVGILDFLDLLANWDL